MTVAPTTPPFPAPAVLRAELPPSEHTAAPDARELLWVAAAAAVVLATSLLNVGETVLARWTPVSAAMNASAADAALSDALLVVGARFLPWILGLLVLTVPFSLRWMPRAYQRLLEPSLVSAWTALFAGAGAAFLLGRYELWPWRWASTQPETATLLSRFMQDEHFAAVGLWAVLACLLVPMLYELFFRFAAIEWLRGRGLSTMMAVSVAALLFGAVPLLGYAAAPDAALRHAAFCTLFGLVLGTLAMRGKRGRGLALAIFAHGAFVATELAMLLGINAGV